MKGGVKAELFTVPCFLIESDAHTGINERICLLTKEKKGQEVVIEILKFQFLRKKKVKIP